MRASPLHVVKDLHLDHCLFITILSHQSTELFTAAFSVSSVGRDYRSKLYSIPTKIMKDTITVIGTTSPARRKEPSNNQFQAILRRTVVVKQEALKRS